MKSKYEIIKDPVYGFLRLEPIPTQEEVEKFYAEEFYSGEFRSFNNSSKEVQLNDREFYERRWQEMLNNLIKFLGRHEDISMFDIGCGFALALQFFKKNGLQVAGMDPAPEAVEYAKNKGLDVYLAGIENFDCVKGRKFDVVTLNNVLEHLRDPGLTLQTIKEELLDDNGILVVESPNEFNDFQTIANEEYDLGQWWICPPNHINYFSSTSLKDLLEKTGYEVADYVASFPLEMFMVMGDVYVGNPEVGRAMHKKRVWFETMMDKYGKTEKLSQLYKAFADCDLGRQIVIYAINKRS